MKKTFQAASERGRANFAWLESFHSFSFGNYHNPSKMNFGALRVLNDDTVAGGMGFGTHAHENMEIITIPLEGNLAHKDSTGREAIIRQHDVQIMSAGSGISHSEKNAQHGKEVKFLQIWVMPKLRNIEPRYEQKSFLPESYRNQLKTVVSPDDKQAVWINQDAYFSLGNLESGFEINYSMHKPNGGVYAFLVSGKVEASGQLLLPRDAVGIWETDFLSVKALEESQILLVEIPMEF